MNSGQSCTAIFGILYIWLLMMILPRSKLEMETASLTIGHEFLDSFCSCIGRKKKPKNRKIHTSFKWYDFIRELGTMKKYSATI